MACRGRDVLLSPCVLKKRSLLFPAAPARRMPHKIRFVVVSSSGHEDGFSARELMIHAPTVSGWRSPRWAGRGASGGAAGAREQAAPFFLACLWVTTQRCRGGGLSAAGPSPAGGLVRLLPAAEVFKENLLGLLPRHATHVHLRNVQLRERRRETATPPPRCGSACPAVRPAVRPAHARVCSELRLGLQVSRLETTPSFRRGRPGGVCSPGGDGVPGALFLTLGGLQHSAEVGGAC